MMSHFLTLTPLPTAKAQSQRPCGRIIGPTTLRLQIMRSPIVALALLLAATVSARQQGAPFVKPIVRATTTSSATDVLQSSSFKSALDVTSTLSDVHSNNIAIRGGGDDVSSSLSLMARLKIGGYFALWYILNVVYNSECLISVILLLQNIVYPCAFTK